MRYLIFVLLLVQLMPISVLGQERILTVESYIATVQEHHPISKQAALLSDLARSQQKQARGLFDPKLQGDWKSKSFDSKNYYSILSGGLKIPSWYGLDFKVNYDRSSGEFLNNSDFLPNPGLWTAGISAPLAKGLLLDERRAALKRAALSLELNEQERLVQLNGLYFEALNAYMEWSIAYRIVQVQENNVQLAQTRFEGTVESFIKGDKPAVDTLESFIAIQSRDLALLEARQHLEAKRIALENFLWIQGTIPLELEDNVAPEVFQLDALSISVDVLHSQMEAILFSHPELQLNALKIDQLDIDRRLAIESIKPDIRVEYNPITAADENNIFQQVNPNNFVLGATVSYSLLQRKARGKLQETKLKMEQGVLEGDRKRQAIKTKLNQIYTILSRNREQGDLATIMIQNYEQLLLAENTKFQLGESSIFLVNSREMKFIESQLKQIDLEAKQMYYQLQYLYHSMKFVE